MLPWERALHFHGMHSLHGRAVWYTQLPILPFAPGKDARGMRWPEQDDGVHGTACNRLDICLGEHHCYRQGAVAGRAVAELPSVAAAP